MCSNEAPIGIFDSGSGGLTVVQEVMRLLPSERVIYLGDIARIPYGTKNGNTVRRYASLCARHLQQHQIKALVVACNTVSSVALDFLKAELHIPVLGVIEAGVRASLQSCTGGHVGIIATTATIESNAYQNVMKTQSPASSVSVQAAPVLVALAEEGRFEGAMASCAAREYLRPLVGMGIDCLLLGCTHYPLLRATLERELQELSGRALPVVDGGKALAGELESALASRGLLRRRRGRGGLTVQVTDLPERFYDVCRRLLGDQLERGQVETIDFVSL